MSVIGPDFRGNVQIGLINQSSTAFTINKEDKITQIILEKVRKPNIKIIDKRSQYQKNTNEYRSTISMRSGKYKQSQRYMFLTPRRTLQRIIAQLTTNDDTGYHINTITDVEDDNNPNIATVNIDINAPYHTTLSIAPIDNTFSIPIETKGTHSTLYLILENYKPMNRIKLINCIPGTPKAKISKWRSILSNVFITSYNNKSINTIENIETLVN